MKYFRKSWLLPFLAAIEFTAIIEFFLYALKPLLFVIPRQTYSRDIQIPILPSDTMPRTPVNNWPVIIGVALALFLLFFVLFYLIRSRYPRWLAAFLISFQILPYVFYQVLLGRNYSIFYGKKGYFECNDTVPIYPEGTFNSNSASFCINPLFDVNWLVVLAFFIGAMILSILLLAFIFRKKVTWLVRLSELFTFLVICYPLFTILFNPFYSAWNDYRIQCSFESVDPNNTSGKLKEVCPTFMEKMQFVISKLTSSTAEHNAKYPHARI